jgi:hypothetical protein
MKFIAREQMWSFFVLIGFCILFSLLVIIPFPIKPNIYLISVVVGALMIDHIIVFGILLFGVVWWLKYTPSATSELVVISGIGIVFYAIRKAFVRESRLALALVMVAIAQVFFWFLFSRGGIMSWVFVVELCYNALLTLLVYEVLVWVKKIFI